MLLVEDDGDLREALELVLRLQGYRVESAADGAEALRWLKGPDARPCLVLLDLMMPGMSGFELRQHMMTDPDLAAVPVVIFTGAGPLALQRSAELQAEILCKPVAISTLLGAIDRHCPRPGAPRSSGPR